MVSRWQNNMIADVIVGTWQPLSTVDSNMASSEWTGGETSSEGVVKALSERAVKASSERAVKASSERAVKASSEQALKHRVNGWWNIEGTSGEITAMKTRVSSLW